MTARRRLLRAVGGAAAAVLFAVSVAAQQTSEADAERTIVSGVAEAARAYRSGNKSLAQTAMKNVAEVAGASPPRLLVMARELLANDLDQLCVQACDQSLKLAPSEVRFRAFRGAARVKLKQYVAAIADLEATVAEKPKEARWSALLGAAYLYGNREADAVKALDRALELEPNNAAALAFRAESDYRNLRLKEAEERCLKALAVHPKNTTAATLLIRVRRAQGRAADAVAAADSALKALGEHGEVRLERGIALLLLERVDDAIKDLEAASKKLADDARPWLHLAKAYARAGRLDDASAAQKKWAELSNHGAK